MECAQTRLAVSAWLDGEHTGVDLHAIEFHLDGCDECRAWRNVAHELTRRARITPADHPVRPGPEAMARFHAALKRPNWTARTDVLRTILLMVAVIQLAVTIPMLVFGDDDAARDLGATDMALTVGLLAVVWRPSRARAISPVVGTAAALLVFIAVLGIADGATAALSEASHAVVFAGWLLVRRIGQLTPPGAEPPGRMPLGGRRGAMGPLRAIEARFGNHLAQFRGRGPSRTTADPSEAPVAAGPEAPAVRRRAAA